MNIIEVMKQVYTAKDLSWLDDSITTQPVIVLKWLSMNPKLYKYVGFLNRYAFILSPKMFLALAWATIPRHPSMPFTKYIKAVDEEDSYAPLWETIQKFLEVSDKDMKYIKRYILPEIENNKQEWFTSLGMKEEVWQQHGLVYDDIKSGGKKEGAKGLALCGL
jgi:hypothetical protein